MAFYGKKALDWAWRTEIKLYAHNNRKSVGVEALNCLPRPIYCQKHGKSRDFALILGVKKLERRCTPNNVSKRKTQGKIHKGLKGNDSL